MGSVFVAIYVWILVRSTNAMNSSNQHVHKGKFLEKLFEGRYVSSKFSEQLTCCIVYIYIVEVLE